MNLLTSPFDTLFEYAAQKCQKVHSSDAHSAVGIRSILGRNIIVLDLEHTLNGSITHCKVYIYCKKYRLTEEWMMITQTAGQPFEKASENEAFIHYEHRGEIKKLIDGKTVTRENEGQLRLAF
jgi:hypothetical protein